MDAVIVSYGANSVSRGKWPAFACVNTATPVARTNEPTFAFTLIFAWEALAYWVFKAFLDASGDGGASSTHARTVKLKPVITVECAQPGEVMVQPSSQSELNEIQRRRFLFGMKSEVTPSDIERKIRDLGFVKACVRVWAWRVTPIIEMKNDETVGCLLSAHGPGCPRFKIGNDRLFTDWARNDGGYCCFGCGVSGHFQQHQQLQQPRWAIESERPGRSDPTRRANLRRQTIANEATRKDYLPSASQMSRSTLQRRRPWR